MAGYYVRVGLLGQIGRFAAVDATTYQRGQRVLCRTKRGVETGEILAPDESPPTDADGRLLRPMLVEDELLEARLQRHRDRAHDACNELLARRGIHATLVDVEHLFDGQSLYFHFLGPTPPELVDLTQELADLYETKVEFRKFVETLDAGCGPGCGTDEAENGCENGGCQSCVIASACRR
jgi:hypothetical protein